MMPFGQSFISYNILLMWLVVDISTT